MMRTCVVGPKPDWVNECEILLKEAVDTAMKSMKPGVKASHIDQITRTILSKNSFGACSMD